MKSIFYILCFALAFSACQKTKETALKTMQLAQSKDSSKSGYDKFGYATFSLDEQFKEGKKTFPTLEKALILNQIFEKPLFDKRDSSAIWIPKDNEVDSFLVSSDERCHSRIDTILYFKDSRNRNCAVAIIATYKYISTKEQIEKKDSSLFEAAAHYDGTTIGVALFAQNADGKWNLYDFRKKVSSLGVWGDYKMPKSFEAGDGELTCNIGLQKLAKNWTALALYNFMDISFVSIEEFNLDGSLNTKRFANLLNYEYHNYEIKRDIRDDVYNDCDTVIEMRTSLKLIEKPNQFADIELITKKKLSLHYQENNPKKSTIRSYGKPKSTFYIYSDEKKGYLSK